MNERDLVLMVNKELIFLLFTNYCLVDQIEKNETGGEFGTYGGEERCIQGFGGEN